ncbi:MAG TPA: PEP-CTERM sorting domain-containing protein [Candidatus Sulfotelmatobacter sp.]|nr:PEP-CTERM sorting domain-containing protein [Candidatus Sulfotelmatobacter sp.]
MFSTDRHGKIPSGALQILVFSFLSLIGTIRSATADTLCSTTSLTNLMGTTCDIGSLQFTFGGFTSQNSTFDSGTGTTTFLTAPSASAFQFSPTSTGFSLSFSGGPLSVSSTSVISSLQVASFTYNVVDLNPGSGNVHDIFTALGASGGVLSSAGVSGFSFALYQGSLCGPVTCIFGGRSVEDNLGVPLILNLDVPDVPNPSLACSQQTAQCFSSGHGTLEIFALSANGGNSASWDGTPTTFTFVTSRFIDPAPEPSSLLLVGSGLLCSLTFVCRKRSHVLHFSAGV